MLFTSYQFIGFVSFLLVAYYRIPKRFQWPLLLAASYLFYFLAGADYLIYILTTTVSTWFAACQIERGQQRQDRYLNERKAELSKEETRAYKQERKAVRLRWAVACVLLNIGILAVVKYTNFVISNVNGILAALGQPGRLSFVTLILPMGISFYTFQAVGYLIDVYRGTIPAEKKTYSASPCLSPFSHSWSRGRSAASVTCQKHCTRPTTSTGRRCAMDCSGSCGAALKSW